MSKQQLSLIGSSEVLDEILTQSKQLELRFSKPVTINHSGNILNAPIGAEELKQLFELITVIIGTASSMISLCKIILDTTKKHPEQIITIRDPKSGVEMGQVTKDTTEDDLWRIIKQ